MHAELWTVYNSNQRQLLNRKQFIEYKLKLATKASTDSAPGSLQSSEKAQLITELTEVKSNLEKLLRQYEKDFGEHFNVGNIASAVSTTSAVVQPVAMEQAKANTIVAMASTTTNPVVSNTPQKSNPVTNIAVPSDSTTTQDQPPQINATVQSRVNAFASKAPAVDNRIAQRRNFQNH